MACMVLCKSTSLEGKVKSGAAAQFGQGVAKAAHVIEFKGAGGAMHSISQEEREAFASHINGVLGSDPVLSHRLPMDPSSDSALFEACADGLIFAKLVNVSLSSA